MTQEPKTPPADAAGGAPPPADSPEQALADAQARAQADRDALLRARADLENLRKRHERDLQNALRYGAEGLIGSLLPARDGLEQALAVAAASAGAEAEVLAGLLEGTRMTLGLLDKALQQAGAREVSAAERFDPAVHQAVSVQESTQVPDGHVLAVVQKGFLLNDRLVRPAMVVVARAPGATDAADGAPS